ncbi:MAG: prepilin-type N-terminal cleavage/methylation domain-containing protein [Zoogloeaceae bacterium]|jgi:prepilin-type N-terminal cleavage/methylation domain-containing protein|nr:prepilin-type N-terminal cleavage/methylation domain-containing protein [Zoogloeaceae bacterium]
MKSFARALQHGFTLVEMVFVLAIIAILVLFALPAQYANRAASNPDVSRWTGDQGRRGAIRAYVDAGFKSTAMARTIVMEAIISGDARNITVAYPGIGAPPPGSYRGFKFQPSIVGDGVARVAINPLVAGSAYGRVGEGTIWVETDGEKVPRFGLKLTAGFGGLLANGQPRVPLLIDPDGNLVDPNGNPIDPNGNPVGPDGHYNVSSMASSIIWGCSLGDGYSVAKYAQFVPPRCRYGVRP